MAGGEHECGELIVLADGALKADEAAVLKHIGVRVFGVAAGVCHREEDSESCGRARRSTYNELNESTAHGTVRVHVRRSLRM